MRPYEPFTYLGSLDDLVSETLGHGLHVAESLVLGVVAQVVDSNVDSAERGHIDGLSADNTTGTDTGGIFTSSTVLDSGDENLDGVSVGHEVDDFHGLSDDGDGLLLLTVVSVSGNHDHVDESLDQGALGLLETTFLVATSGVGSEDALSGVLDLEVALEGDVFTLNVIVRPFAEKGGVESEFRSVVELNLF